MHGSATLTRASGVHSTIRSTHVIIIDSACAKLKPFPFFLVVFDFVAFLKFRVAFFLEFIYIFYLVIDQFKSNHFMQEINSNSLEN